MAGHKNKKVIYAALAGNTEIAITKIAAALYTGSSAGRRHRKSDSAPLWVAPCGASGGRAASFWIWTRALLLGLRGSHSDLRGRRRSVDV